MDSYFLLLFFQLLVDLLVCVTGSSLPVMLSQKNALVVEMAPETVWMDDEYPVR